MVRLLLLIFLFAHSSIVHATPCQSPTPDEEEQRTEEQRTQETLLWAQQVERTLQTRERDTKKKLAAAQAALEGFRQELGQAKRDAQDREDRIDDTLRRRTSSRSDRPEEQ